MLSCVCDYLMPQSHGEYEPNFQIIQLDGTLSLQHIISQSTFFLDFPSLEERFASGYASGFSLLSCY